MRLSPELSCKQLGYLLIKKSGTHFIMVVKLVHSSIFTILYNCSEVLCFHVVPDVLNCGGCLAGDSKLWSTQITNYGGEGKFKLMLSGENDGGNTDTVCFFCRYSVIPLIPACMCRCMLVAISVLLSTQATCCVPCVLCCIFCRKLIHCQLDPLLSLPGNFLY